MEKIKIVLYSLVHAFAVLAYIMGVVYFMQTVGTWFGGKDTILSVAPVLLLLVFSVSVMGVLVFGRPVYLFVTGFRREAVEFLIYTMGWMLVILILFIGIMTQVSPKLT